MIRDQADFVVAHSDQSLSAFAGPGSSKCWSLDLVPSRAKPSDCCQLPRGTNQLFKSKILALKGSTPFRLSMERRRGVSKRPAYTEGGDFMSGCANV